MRYQDRNNTSTELNRFPQVLRRQRRLQLAIVAVGAAMGAGVIAAVAAILS
jgi:hypothetical protein